MIKKLIYKYLYTSPYIRHCSQTVYESLLGCIRMYEATKDKKWKARAKKVFKILVKIQRPDGGFDINYDFNFGLYHKKGDSTSPELIGLLALSEYARVFDARKLVKSYAKKAAIWIEKFSTKQPDGSWAIPYSPYTTSEIMVYNGTSFACGALGTYLKTFHEEKPLLDEIYHGMVKYLDKNLYKSNKLNGRFWYYPVQKRTDIPAEELNKIDYYHQMQQVEIHSIAEQQHPYELQLQIIEDCCDHIVDLSRKYDVIPYTNGLFFGNRIHVWGLCSVVAGLVEASKLIPEKRSKYTSVAEKTLSWLQQNSWNGSYFYPVLQQNGTVALPNEYMVRSDAWVFNAFTCYYKNVKGNDELSNIIEDCYTKMEHANFSGRENHAASFRKKMISKVIIWTKKTI